MDPRNFHILPRDVHAAFDSGWLLLIPRRGSGEGGTSSVLIRASRTDDVVVLGDPGSAATLNKRAWLRSLDGTSLVFKSAARPFMRVLGWRAWSTRAEARDVGDGDDASRRSIDAAVEDAASIDAEGNRALRSVVGRCTAVCARAE